MIKSQRLLPGDRLPSERELAQTYQVSRMTARQALRELETEGVLVRIQGAGSYVSEAKLVENVLELSSFTEDIERRGMASSTRLLGVRLCKPDELLRRALLLTAQHLVCQIDRLRLADGTPMSLETMYLAAHRFPGIENKDLSGSIYRLLQDDYGLQIGMATQTIEAVYPSTTEAQLLAAPARTAFLRLKKLTASTDAVPFESVTALYRGDRYAFETQLFHRPAGTSD